jgi:predicted DCC family thiol-disulfide oxidoreductase YuxK
MTLPTIEERPRADVVIFDGQCRFCRAQVRRLAGFDGGQRLAFLSLHDRRAGELYPDLTHDQLMEQMYVVTPRGERYGGANALRYLSRRLPRLWAIAPLLHIPFSLPLWRWLYGQVARRRYALAGRETCEGDACKLHTR